MEKYKLIDSYVGKGEITLTEEDDLRNILESFLQYGTRIVTLESSKSGSLTLGIGEPYGFVEYMHENADPPYLIATDNKIGVSDSFIEFDAGGTPTPISVDKCLPLKKVIDIAVHFFRNQNLPSYVNWREV